MKNQGAWITNQGLTRRIQLNLLRRLMNGACKYCLSCGTIISSRRYCYRCQKKKERTNKKMKSEKIYNVMNTYFKEKSEYDDGCADMVNYLIDNLKPKRGQVTLKIMKSKLPPNMIDYAISYRLQSIEDLFKANKKSIPKASKKKGKLVKRELDLSLIEDDDITDIDIDIDDDLDVEELIDDIDSNKDELSSSSYSEFDSDDTTSDPELVIDECTTTDNDSDDEFLKSASYRERLDLMNEKEKKRKRANSRKKMGKSDILPPIRKRRRKVVPIPLNYKDIDKHNTIMNMLNESNGSTKSNNNVYVLSEDETTEESVVFPSSNEDNPNYFSSSISSDEDPFSQMSFTSSKKRKVQDYVPPADIRKAYLGQNTDMNPLSKAALTSKVQDSPLIKSNKKPKTKNYSLKRSGKTIRLF